MDIISILQQALDDKCELHSFKLETNNDYTAEDKEVMRASEAELAAFIADLQAGKGGPDLIVRVAGGVIQAAWCDIPANMTVIDVDDMEDNGTGEYLQDRGFDSEASLEEKLDSMFPIW